MIFEFVLFVLIYVVLFCLDRLRGNLEDYEKLEGMDKEKAIDILERRGCAYEIRRQDHIYNMDMFDDDPVILLEIQNGKVTDVYETG